MCVGVCVCGVCVGGWVGACVNVCNANRTH